MEQIIEKAFSKHLMERSELLRYAGEEYSNGKKIRIIIEYDPEAEKGTLELFRENPDIKY